MKHLFWLTAGLILYAYFIYPIVLTVLCLIFRKRVNKAAFYPAVSIVISAFNEEKYIGDKIVNLLEKTNYPKEKIEILIGSDGASDATDQIISKYPSAQIRFFRFIRNMGKPSVLNALVKEARSQFVVFTDARQRFDADALEHLIANFRDGSIGCVSGELHFESGDFGTVGKGMGAYWKYEKFLRRTESELGSMLGATGAIYAIRRRLFEPVPSDIVVDDMFIPLSIIRQGYRAIFEPEAQAFDKPSTKSAQEFSRKVRTLSGNWQIISFFPDLVNPLSGLTTWQFFSHKFLRLLVPFLMMGALFSNLLIADELLYAVFLICQIMFYALAAVGYLLAEKKTGLLVKKIAALPYMVCLLNASALFGLFHFLAGKPKGSWQKAYAS